MVVNKDESFDSDVDQVVVLPQHLSLLLFGGPFTVQHCYDGALLLTFYNLLHYLGFTLLGKPPFIVLYTLSFFL
jgi:hypothetical protein